MKKLMAIGLVTVSLTACSASDKEVVESKDANVVIEKEVAVEKPIDLEKSKLVWLGSKVVGNSHDGEIKISEGEILFEDDKFVGGNFVIDMNTIDSYEDLEKLEDHLKSADFFEVETYPTAKFEVTKVEELVQDEFTHMIEGNLEIKGISRSISFPAVVMEGEGVITANAEFAIDRTEWDIRYGSGKFFDGLGDNMIRDEIEFDVEIVVVK